MKFLNKTTLKIALSCFLAPTFLWIVFLLYIILLYQSIGFKNYIVIKNNVLGCILQPWKTYFQIIQKFYHLFWIVLGYAVSRKGFIQQNNNLKILGAFLFYPAVFLSFRNLIHKPLYFLANKDFFMTFKNTPIFGNLYDEHWFMFIIQILLLMLVIVVSYRIMFKFWDKKMRIYYLTIGFISASLGELFWFRLVGNLFVQWVS
jgi:hypothetical protein